MATELCGVEVHLKCRKERREATAQGHLRKDKERE